LSKEVLFKAQSARKCYPFPDPLWKKKFPFLKAKAAQIRHLSKFCFALASRQEHGDAGVRQFEFRPGSRLAIQSETHRTLVRELFGYMVAYNDSISAAVFDAPKCSETIRNFLYTYKILHNLWGHGLPDELRGQLPWHLRPKHHQFGHLAEQLHIFGSPSSTWCYGQWGHFFTRVVSNTQLRVFLPDAACLFGCQKPRSLGVLSCGVVFCVQPNSSRVLKLI
jgi:hypothetical protein